MPESTKKDAHATTLGARLKWLRQFKGLTIRQFAARVGCDPGYISKLENGKASNPSDRFIVTLTTFFTANEAWLRSGDGEPILSQTQSESTGIALPDWTEQRIQRILAVLDDLPEALATDAVLGRVLRDLTIEQLRELLVEVSKLPNMPATARAFWFEALGRLQGPKIYPPPVSQVTLDTSAHLSDSASMQSLKSVPDLVAKLNKLSKHLGSKAALARKLGVSRQAVDQWLNGTTTPSTDIAIQVMNLK